MPHVFSPSVPLSERQALTMGEAASLIGLSVSYLYILMQRGELRTVKIGGRRLVPRDALDELLGRAPPPGLTAGPPEKPGASRTAARAQPDSEK
jgi:excisionase family DNA binding protein